MLTFADFLSDGIVCFFTRLPQLRYLYELQENWNNYKVLTSCIFITVLFWWAKDLIGTLSRLLNESLL